MDTQQERRASKIILYVAYTVAIAGFVCLTWLFFRGTGNPAHR
jgi:hypothetical protein